MDYTWVTGLGSPAHTASVLVHAANVARFSLRCQERMHFVLVCRLSLELTSRLCNRTMSCFSVVRALRYKYELLETPKSRCKLADPSLASNPSPLELAIR